jgi:hypothetical protein
MFSYCLVTAIILASSLTLMAQTTPPFPTVPEAKPRTLPAAFTNKALLLVNAAGLPDDQVETLRAFAQKDLWLKVEVVNLKKTDWNALPAQLPTLFTSNRTVIVALAKGSPENARILVAPDNAWSIVNVSSIATFKDKQDHMLRQQTMRGIGFAFGVAACLDPHCCMKSSRVMTDLSEDVGYNFCPLSRKEFTSLAPHKGLFSINPILRGAVTKPAAPKPDAIPAKP